MHRVTISAGTGYVAHECTGTTIAGGNIAHDGKASCPIHPEVEAYARGLTEGKRIQYKLMIEAFGERGESESYKDWWYGPHIGQRAGYLDRFHRFLACEYLEQTTNPEK